MCTPDEDFNYAILVHFPTMCSAYIHSFCYLISSIQCTEQWMFTHRKSASTLPSTAHPKRHGSKSQKQSGTIHKSITSYGLVGNAAHSHFQSANMSRHVNRQVCAANKQPQRATRHIQN
eukprot:305125_1